LGGLAIFDAMRLGIK